MNKIDFKLFHLIIVVNVFVVAKFFSVFIFFRKKWQETGIILLLKISFSMLFFCINSYATLSSHNILNLFLPLRYVLVDCFFLVLSFFLSFLKNIHLRNCKKYKKQFLSFFFFLLYESSRKRARTCSFLSIIFVIHIHICVSSMSIYPSIYPTSKIYPYILKFSIFPLYSSFI